MKTKIKMILLFMVVLIMFFSCSNNKQQAILKDKIEGKVKRENIYIAPKVAGRIIKLLVNEGDMVKAGDTLAVIDIPDIEAKLLQTEGAFLSAKAQYDMAEPGATSFEREQIKAKLMSAKEQFELAEKSYKRIKAMVDDSLISQQKYDEVFEKYRSAKAQLDAVTSQKKDIDYGIRAEKKEMAKGDMKRAEGAFREAESGYKERFIIAPNNMKIETIALHKGELALPGYNIFIGYNMDDIYFRFTVSERGISAFHQGEIYMIILPFDKNSKTISAKLISIKDIGGYAKKTVSYPNYEIGEATYELKFSPVKSNETFDLFTNMSVLLNSKNE